MIVHHAALPIGLVQRCQDCGEVLIDYGGVMRVSSESDRPLSWWSGYVAIDGRHQTIADAGEIAAFSCQKSTSAQ